MRDWRTHCFECFGSIADETGASLYGPFPPMDSGPTMSPVFTPPAPALTIPLDDPAKPSIKLTYTDATRAAAPAFWAKPTPDPSFTPRKGAFKAGATAGVWEAVIPLDKNVLAVELRVFKTLNETKNPHAKPIGTETIWFKTAATKGGAPTVMTTPAPDLDGDLGTCYLDSAKLDVLSEKRKKVIRDFLPMVVPSVVGSPAFDMLQTKADVDKKTAEFLPKRYTTCGTLPSFLSKQFNEPLRPKRCRIGGLAGCYWAAHDDGSHDPDKPAWVTAVAGLEPRPGDIFLITDETTTPAFIEGLIPIQDSGHEEHDLMTQTYPKEIFVTLHVGVIVDTSPVRTTAGGIPLWIVAEAGQGGDTQMSLYNTRMISADANNYPMMAGRRLAGWVDIDNYTPWT